MPLRDLKDLEEALEPIVRGEVSRAAVDTETSEVKDDRFTPYATDTRVAGFSVSYDLGGRGVDIYVPVRHRPYDWRRPMARIQADADNLGGLWVERLLEVEGVAPPADPSKAGEELGGSWKKGADPNLDPGQAFALLGRAMAVAGCTWWAHNWPFDAPMLKVEGIVLPFERMEDSQTWSVFTDPRPLDKFDEQEGRYVHGGHSLKHLGEVHLGIPADQQKELAQAQAALGPGSSSLMCYDLLPLVTAVAPYGKMDTRLVLNLADHMLRRSVADDPKVRELIARHNRELRYVVDMMETGMPVDKQLALSRCDEQEKLVAQFSTRANELAGGRVLPLGNGAELSKVLYQDLGLPRYRDKCDTRKATLKQVRSRIVLEQGGEPTIPKDDAVALLDTILDYRKAVKRLTSFYRPLTKFGEGGRVHTTLRPLRALTTRFAASAPNSMQMEKPKKSKDPEEARRNQEESVRHLFKPDPGFCFFTPDFSQQEMRVAGHYTLAVPSTFEYRVTWNCTNGKRGSCKGRGSPHGPKEGDAIEGMAGELYSKKAAMEECKKYVHVGWWAAYSKRPPKMGLADGFLKLGSDFDPHSIMVDWVEHEGVPITRDDAKTADFALLYGCGIFKLMETIDCSFEVARAVFNIFWNKAYPELGRVREFIGERLRRVGKRGPWSHQDFIRTLHGAPIYLDGGFKGLNYVVQRSCREILLNAILSVGDYLEEERAPFKIVLPVHDELILYGPRNELDEGLCRGITRRMVDAGSYSKVPMVVEATVAEESWAIKEKLPGWGWDGVSGGPI